MNHVTLDLLCYDRINHKKLTKCYEQSIMIIIKKLGSEYREKPKS